MARPSISKIYIGSPEAVSTECETLKTGIVDALEKQGMKLMPEAMRDGVMHSLMSPIDIQKIGQADAYLFMGKPDAVSLFQLWYLIDRAQTRLPGAMLKDENGELLKDAAGNVLQKPIVLLNPHGEFDAILQRARDLMDIGAAKQPLENFLDIAHTPEQAQALLKGSHIRKPGLFIPTHVEHEETEAQEPRGLPQIFVCCGFSIQEKYFIETAKRTAQLLAPYYDFITGGGRGGMMHQFQKAAYDAGAHVTGVTIPDLNTLVKDVPEHKSSEGRGSSTFGVSLIKKAPEIIKRVEMMSENASATLILPGGYGTDTEGFAAILAKKLDTDTHSKGPVILQNLVDPKDVAKRRTDPGHPVKRCHDSLIFLLREVGFREGEDFKVVNPPLMLNEAGEMDLDASVEKAAQLTAREIQKYSMPKKAMAARGA